VVLEALAESSIDRSGEAVSEKSVRGLADEIGLAKDTIARAVRRLQRAGLVSRIDARLTDGRFGHGCYVLDIPDDVFNVCAARVASTTKRRAATKPARRPEQLALPDVTNETR
jgi:DNA-binding Lrp family transcriptional regulator